MKDFFISYNRADRHWAEWIAWQLEEAEYSTVLQAWDFRPGGNFVLEMDKAAREAQHTIAVLSQAYLLDALYTQPEWAAAFAKDPTGEKGALLLVRVGACDLQGLLGQVIYIDLVGTDEPAAKEALLAGVRRERAKPAIAPRFPYAVERSVTKRPAFPGGLPSVWNLPRERNRNFTGRESLLTDLRDALTSGNPAALTQAISGLGGVGKTELAVEYAYRHASDYEVIWWVRAEEPAQLAGDYAALAAPLCLPQRDQADQRLIVEAVRRRLGEHAGWLLVFDNVREPSDLKGYLPQAATGHVIVTSRNQAWRGVANPLLVDVLKRPESVEFLLKRTGQTDEKAAGALAEALGDLPLALEQAGGYMDEAGTSLSAYLALFGARQAELLSKGVPATGYEFTVATTWNISLQRAQEESPAAADLLNLCAFLAPDDIPLDVITAGAEHLPEALSQAVTDPMKLDEALAALRRYSLVKVGDNTLSVHRLVQEVMRDRLAADGRKTWAEAAVRVLNRAFPYDSDDVRTWPDCARLLPHGMAAAGHAEPLGLALESAGRLLNQMGLYLRGRAQFVEARATHERALRISEAAYGTDHPDVATDLNNLGRVLQDLGDLEGARAHFERALRISEAARGSDHPDVAICVNNLGGLLWDLGNLGDAEAYLRRALSIFEATRGPNHPETAAVVGNLGSVLRGLGDLEGARACFERALVMVEGAYGPDHPNVATTVNNLGSVLQDLGDLEGARACFERALRIDEAAYGPNHPDVARDVNNLGFVLQDLGDLEGARAHFERALNIFRAFLGDDHPKTVVVRKNLELLGGR
jgi:tetratricopeptide (TPR) repeat protein